MQTTQRHALQQSSMSKALNTLNDHTRFFQLLFGVEASTSAGAAASAAGAAAADSAAGAAANKLLDLLFLTGLPVPTFPPSFEAVAAAAGAIGAAAAGADSAAAGAVASAAAVADSAAVAIGASAAAAAVASASSSAYTYITLPAR